MDSPGDTPLLATAIRDDDDPMQWVVRALTARQAVTFGAFLRWTCRPRAANVRFDGRETFAEPPFARMRHRLGRV